MLDRVVPLVIKDNIQLSSPAKTKTKTRIKQLQNAPVYMRPINDHAVKLTLTKFLKYWGVKQGVPIEQSMGREPHDHAF